MQASPDKEVHLPKLTNSAYRNNSSAEKAIASHVSPQKTSGSRLQFSPSPDKVKGSQASMMGENNAKTEDPSLRSPPRNSSKSF